jgi:hypothetical protein
MTTLKLEKEFETLMVFIKTFASTEEYAQLDEFINYAGEYGQGFGCLLGVIANHKQPIPEAIYNQVVKIGQFLYNASKELGYTDVTPDMWESLKSLVISER